MPTDRILNIIDELYHLGGVEITLSGGEPLTHPDIVSIIEYASAKLRVKLLTNGTLIDKNMAHLLGDLGVKVQISLDGSTAEVHDCIRGKGAYTRARRGIDLLRNAGAGVKLNLCTVVMKDNLDDLFNIITVTQEWGLPLQRFIPLRCAGRAKTTWEQNQPSPAEYSDFFHRVFTQTHNDLQVSSGLSGLVFSSPRQKVQDRWCPLGSKLDILHDGDVFPCVFLMERKFRLGNIYHHKLADIFSTDKLKHLVRDCHNRREEIDRCRECLWRNFCQAGCPGLAYAHTGSLWGIDDFCRLRQELYPQLIFKLARKKLYPNQTQNIKKVMPNAIG
jgi:radical SAM protein with 4Fe4S-binding SPASM domain